MERFPANVSPVVNAPYSLFLEDYTDPGKNQLVANIVFNDFNEPSWTFKLRLTIESADVRIRTRNDFTPIDPITVQPGVLHQFTSTDWQEYLNFNNLEISGSGANLVRQNGRLPEGLYSFCLEVLDYETGDALSRETCTNVWIQLNDPPRIISPQCGNIVDPQLTSFPIQWQLFNTQSPNAQMGTSYDLTIWQLTDPSADPMVAVPNGQALQVFTTSNLSSPTFIYGPGQPLLDLGKTYVYQIKASSIDGRDSYKNKGKSEFCYFSYGWPEGGSIELAWPEFDGGFRSEEQPYLSWRAPNNKRANQPVEYLVEVMKLKDGQSAEEAYVANEPWFSYQQPPTFNNFGGSINLPNLGKSEKYAWKVTAFTGEQIVAESEIGLMNGPSLVEFFYAGNHRVNVDYINGKDVTNISGGGAVRVTPAVDQWTNLTFKNISLVDNGGFWVLESGTIEFDIPQPRNITIKPRYEDNQDGTFEIQKYKLNREGLFAFGTFFWDLPFATLSSEKPVVHSIEQWANFNNFKVNTVINLPENANRFDLLDPYDFTIDLKQSSLVFINDDQFKLEFDGDVYVPDVVRRMEDTRASFRFDNAPDLFYIYGNPDAFVNAIQPIQNTLYWLRSSNYVIDFSDKQSPGIHEGNLEWKGIDLVDYSLTYEKSPDHKGQLNFDVPFRQSYTQDGGERFAYINADGLTLKLHTDYNDLEDGLKFQTFPSNPLSLDLEIEKNVVSDKCKLRGDFLIPFVSLDNRFGYEIPINNLGFEKGFLLDVEGFDFYFNKGALEQEIYVKINRAVLSGNERITMNIDMDWPGMDVKLKGLRDFKVWGDYSVGFSAKNGTVALEERKNALMSAQKYPVTIDVIGAGSYDGRYFFATTADIVLGEDVSGPDAEPTVNVYSSVENPFVPTSANGSIASLPDEGPSYEEVVAQVESEIAAYEESLLAKLNEGSRELQEEAEAYKQSLASGTEIYAPDDIVKNGDQASEANNKQKKDKLYPVVEGFVTVLASHYLEPLDQTMNDLNQKVEEAVLKETDKAKSFVNRSVDNLVDQVTQQLINSLQNSQIDVAPIVNEIGIATKQAIKNEITSSLDQSVKNNVTDPVKTLLIDQFMQRVYAYLIENSTEAIYATLKGNADGGDIASKYADGLMELATETTKDVANFISPENLQSTIEGLASDFVQGIDMKGVASEISGRSKDIILKSLEQLAKDKAADLAQEYLAEAGLPPFLAGENPIDFAGIGSKLADGDYAGAIKDALPVDPLPLKMRTPVVDLEGWVEYRPSDPTYGNVWSGDIDMKVKVPKPFVLNATYINGLKGDNSYWFVEIRGNDDEGDGESKPYKLGDPIDRTVKPLKNPVNMGIANLVGVSGRLYHHMAETDNGGIVPDPEMRFGAFMNVVFFDTKGGNNLRLAVAGEINTKENGDYTLEFDGDIQMRNKAPDVVRIDENAAIQGVVLIKYNSAEKHFFGYASVELYEPNVLCAEGSILVDVKPGEWRVALGSRDDRLRFVPGCVGWSPTGWLDINQNQAELGLGVEWSVRAQTPTIPVIIWKVRFAAEAGFAFGILAAVQYTPDLALAKLGIWADVYARLVMEYKKVIGIRPKWKSTTLVDISLSGDLILYFIPKPTTLEGSLRGRVQVLFFSKSINASFSKEI
ncbi:hypothetical protein [Ekhidna sp.]|uniref:hypothetical protein n=1 Tax=Ekhidna sp. TaxID=2608089 RepID=UPI00355988D1